MLKFISCFLFLIPSIVFAQNFHLGIFGGVSHYKGDLVDKYYVGRFTKPAIGITGTYELSERINVRVGFTYAKVEGDDKYNTKEYLRERNLNFESKISEFSLLGEYNFFNLSSMRWTPYAFGGLAVYHFNPFTYDSAGIKTFLKPLSTEGQGLDQYPESKPYSLTQIALPFGGGVKYTLSENIRVGLEIGVRKLFTDHLDDLSTNYVDAADLLAARGPKAVQLAFRGDEVGNSAYPQKGAQRGGANMKDWYYFTGLHFTFRLGDGYGSTGGKKGYGCPKVY